MLTYAHMWIYYITVSTKEDECDKSDIAAWVWGVHERRIYVDTHDAMLPGELLYGGYSI